MNKNLKPSIFIGSTGERSDIADAMVQQLSPIAEVTHWQDAFPPGPTIFDNLMSLKDAFDFAVFVLTADDFINIRGSDYNVPRDNVIFELGLFLGSIGAGRVFAVIDENVKTKLPSDLGGVVYLVYNGNRQDKKVSAALRPACISIREQVASRGVRKVAHETNLDSQLKSLIGADRIFPSYVEAEPEIFKSFQKTNGPIRLLLYVASQNVGIKGPILDLIDESSKRGVEVKVLHASPSSPTFSRERIELLGKDHTRIQNTIEFVSAELGRFSESGATVFRRGHDLPFVWRLYIFPEHAYVMPYFADKDATVKSPVVRFHNSNMSMYSSFIELYEYIWRIMSPKRISVDDLITEATSTSAAIIANWNGRHVFGIPKRDLESKSGQLRFYGLGGKREAIDKSLEDCAIREGNEESSGAVSHLVSSPKTIIYRYNGTSEEIEISDEGVQPTFIIEKQKSSSVTGRRPQIPDQLMYTFCYFAELKKKPKPSREIAAILVMDSDHLKLFKRSSYVTVSDLQDLGAEVIEAEGMNIDMDSILVPHGTANFLLNQ